MPNQVVQFEPPLPVPTAWVKRILQRMAVLYGKKFADQWEGIDPVVLEQEWAMDLAGYTGDEIARGLEACKTQRYVPTLPEFCALCRPGLVPEIAFQDAVAGMSARRRGEIGYWSHPAVYWAAVAVGSHDLLNCGYGVMKGRWERALTDELGKGRWPAIPQVAAALPAPGGTQTSKAEAARRLAELGAADALSESGRDQRRWIAKVLDRVKRKKSVPLGVLRMAQQALEEQGGIQK